MYISSVSFLFPTVPSARAAPPHPPPQERRTGRGAGVVRDPPVGHRTKLFVDGVLTERVGPQNTEMFEKGRVVEGKKEREREETPRRPR